MGQQYTDASSSSFGWIVIVILVLGIGGYLFSSRKSGKRRPAQKGGVGNREGVCWALLLAVVGLVLGAFLL